MARRPPNLSQVHTGRLAPVPIKGRLQVPSFQPFKPYKPPPPPAGSYDPALDAQLGAAHRGYEDLQQDTATADLRAGVDYGLDRGDVVQRRDRGYADLGLNESRTREDYGWQTQMLDRSYAQLARRQAEGARASGVLSGGLALQAAAKRAENEAVDRHPLDVNFNRAITDIGTQRTRLGEDTDSALGRLALGYERGGQDRTSQLARAGREGAEFGQDVAAQRLYQAAQSGYVAPGPPKGQGVTAKGTPYKDKKVGNYIYRYDKSGKIISKRKA